jgi:thiamine-monophosphate kinase
MSNVEFQIIRRWFSNLGSNEHVLAGVGDDAAVLAVPDGHVLHTSTDTLIEGRHFLPETLPEDVGFRAVATAASDLAAMGAEPLGMTLALTLPDRNELWLNGFSQGLAAAVLRFDLPLVGGDTTRGERSITVTVLGTTPRGEWLSRAGARPGDRVCVSGTVGDAAMALAVLQGEIPPDGLPSPSATENLLKRFSHPEPRLGLGIQLRGRASAAIDLSDGLMADAAHVAEASGAAIHIDSGRLPLSNTLKSHPDRDQALQWALGGGDDYELLFTIPPEYPVPPGCTEIGEVRHGRGVHSDIPVKTAGYDHFGN